MAMSSYDIWKSTTPEDEFFAASHHVCDCEFCGESLYEGMEVIEDVNEDICFCDDDCFSKYQIAANSRTKVLEAREREWD